MSQENIQVPKLKIVAFNRAIEKIFGIPRCTHSNSMILVPTITWQALK